MERWAYFARRALLMIPTFIGITVLCFSLTRFLPGGPVEIRMMRQRAMGGGGEGGAAGTRSSMQVTEDYRNELIKQFGFDKPIYKQYYDWLVTNRMGLKMPSYDYPNKTAWQLIKGRIPVSVWFGLVAFVLEYLICIPLGIAKALRHGEAFDATSSVIVFFAYSIPAFALAMVLKMCFCGTVDGLWDIFPLGGISSDFAVEPTWWEWFKDRAWHMVLPVTCYVMGAFAMLTLLMKNSLLDQISADYVRTVIAKGGTRTRAIWGHAFRNALVPIATGFGSMIGVIFAGSIIIEMVFEIPGMGRLGLDALLGRDYAVFLGLLSITACIQLVGNIISDFLYILIDPRIDFSRK
ncbi:MAG: ABC transporter permease subunit [Kiritimatiellae bacterium]|nr:ABC transporter permease subunit [Kiritimatiellia bacterium]